MSELYTRRATLALKKETTNNVPVIPNTFVPFEDENLAVKFEYAMAQAVAGVRSLNRRAVIGKINPGEGTLNVKIEPKTFGHFLQGLGVLTSGVVYPISSASAAFTVGETVTGGTSAQTAVVLADVNSEYLLLGTISGAFTVGETITGGTSASTAVVGTYNAAVYGHVATLPVELTTSYSVQINYAENAIRFFGVRFSGLDALAQKDNIITAGIKCMAQGVFRHAKVTAITASGAGAKTIVVDQTLGLVATDVIKVYRPGTGFLDFASASVKTHAVTSVTDALNFVVTNLQTSTAVGDLIVLAPQTATYAIDKEFPWVGGSEVFFGAAIGSTSSIAAEDFTMQIQHGFEARYGAQGSAFSDRFPSAILQKGLEASGSIKLYYQNEDFFRYLRKNTAAAVKFVAEGQAIAATTLLYTLKVYMPEVQFDSFDSNVDVDSLVDSEMPFKTFYNTSGGYEVKMFLLNDIASY